MTPHSAKLCIELVKMAKHYSPDEVHDLLASKAIIADIPEMFIALQDSRSSNEQNSVDYALDWMREQIPALPEMEA